MSEPFPVVSEADARARPYPYVYVEEDGGVRELTAEERRYLETPFLPGDGGRPYVKRRHDDRTPEGRRAGFFARARLPNARARGKAARPAPWWRFW